MQLPDDGTRGEATLEYASGLQGLTPRQLDVFIQQIIAKYEVKRIHPGEEGRSSTHSFYCNCCYNSLCYSLAPSGWTVGAVGAQSIRKPTLLFLIPCDRLPRRELIACQFHSSYLCVSLMLQSHSYSLPLSSSLGSTVCAVGAHFSLLSCAARPHSAYPFLSPFVPIRLDSGCCRSSVHR